jgi:hypothetical protein
MLVDASLVVATDASGNRGEQSAQVTRYSCWSLKLAKVVVPRFRNGLGGQVLSVSTRRGNYELFLPGEDVEALGFLSLTGFSGTTAFGTAVRLIEGELSSVLNNVAIAAWRALDSRSMSSSTVFARPVSSVSCLLLSR